LQILVFEYITGGGLLAEPLPVALVREGDRMLAALLRDLSEIPGVRTLALRDARLGIPGGATAPTQWFALTRDDDVDRRFADLLRRCDAAWPIAPETGGTLERLCLRVESEGKGLLTSPAAAVRIAASKLETARRLESREVPVVPTWRLDPTVTPRFPVVVKPDDGVGGEGARILENSGDWSAFLRNLPAGDAVVQPLMEGEALSLSVLFAQGEARLLGCNRQHIVRVNGGFALKGCSVNALREESGIFRGLAQAIARAVPELWGYAGVDLIRSEGGLRVLEINPRLTTSYAGLRASTGLNPAGMVLYLWRYGALPAGELGPVVPVDISLESRHGD